MYDDEKLHGGKDGGLDVQHVLDQSNGASSPAAQSPEREDKETRRLIRKIDMRLLPMLATIYAFALIDRVNLPNVCIVPLIASIVVINH